MEIKTKYNRRDKCYFFDENGVLSHRKIESINVSVDHRGININYWFAGESYLSTGLFREEKDVYASKKELSEALNNE